MLATKQNSLTIITRGVWKWRYAFLAILVAGQVWWTTPHWHPYLQSSPYYQPLRALGTTLAAAGGGDAYSEAGIPFATFATQACDPATLPDRVRLLRPAGEAYWLLGHGFSGGGGGGRLAPVRLNHFGLGAAAARACVASADGNMGDSVVHEELADCEAANRVDMGTLDHYYRVFLRGRKVALAKIDIQGFEVTALRYGTELFDSADAPVVVVFEWEPPRMRLKGDNPAEVFRYFETRGYLMFNFADGAVIESAQLSDVELEALDDTVEDVVAIKSSWMSQAQSAGYEFDGGLLIPHAG